jgi:subtilisin family serine protease
MASPVVAGLAALILCYYPELTAVQVKSIIEKSVTLLPGKSVKLPGTEDALISLTDLSHAGGIVNAYEALKLAAITKGERKNEISETATKKLAPKKK